MSTPVIPTIPRAPSPETLTIRWIKSVLKHYASQKSKYRGARLHSCALLKALSRLQGNPDSHVLKGNRHGYTKVEVSGLADAYVARAKQRGIAPEDKFKCYVLVDGGTRNGVPIPMSHRYVQAAHALMELTHQHKGHPDFERWITVDQTLVLLDATSAQSVYYGFPRHSEITRSAGFWDRDFGYGIALAIFPLTPSEAEALRLGEFKLLG